MLRIALQQQRRPLFGLLHGNRPWRCTGIYSYPAGTTNTVRSYWGFSQNDDEDGDSIRPQRSSSDGEEGGDDKNIVSPHGDNSPTLSPLLILPSRKRPIFPGYLSTIMLKDEATIDALVNNSSSSSGYVGVFLHRDPDSGGDEMEGTTNGSRTDVINDIKDIYTVGTFAQIQHAQKMGDGMQLMLLGHRRINLGEVHSLGPPTIANVDHWEKPRIAGTASDSDPHLKAYLNEVMVMARELIKDNPLLQEQLQQWVSKVDFNNAYKLADFATVLTTAEGSELQKVLEAADPMERLSLTLDLLAKEKELAKLQKEISKKVEEKVSKQQKEYFLREQLKNIKKELGIEKDDKDDLVTKYSKSLEEIEARPGAPADTLKLIRDEVKKLESLEKNSPEFNVTRSYLDWLVAVPWAVHSQDILNLASAKTVLDEDHYGLEEIKDRILEFIAVGKLKGSVAGKIICFVGPPGVGKTSIAKSVARSLDKRFYRFSVGGLTDTAEIKGHRRTYVGAMPGKPVQCLKTTGCLNPLILIDEIDKLGRSYSGDPASALLELLDPNQNSSFVDHYLDHPIDFSGVLFVCTANDESTIPGPLRDRMEIIRLSGYDIPEKVAIAKRYLVPKALSDAGLVPVSIQEEEREEEEEEEDEESAAAAAAAAAVDLAEHQANQADPQPEYIITEGALHTLIKNYCRESGVRSLEKMIEKIVRKIALNKVREDEKVSSGGEASSAAAVGEDRQESIVITEETLEDYIGKPIFPQDSIYESTNESPGLPPGVVMGLAWNPLGGSPIFIETAAIPVAYSERDTSGVHMVTGQLGDVMKESVNIAYTFARQYLTNHVDSENKFFHSHQLHLHVPEGAVSKDGPSAGVAMTTSLLSIAMGKSVNPNVAMTGEISLTGKVLPVGGIKEKVLAARRSGALHVILPAGNKRDHDELPEYVRDNIRIHFATDYTDAYNIAFASESGDNVDN